MDVIIIDFDDSFTYNIAAELYSQNIPSEVIHYKIFLENFEIYLKSAKVFIFGPGPGHPDEYSPVVNKIKVLLENPSSMLFNICLGHQLMGMAMGKKVFKSALLRHGVRESITVPNWPSVFEASFCQREVEVQYYSSLCVKGDEKGREKLYSNADGEIQIISFGQHLSYQFHPESVGTSCRKHFFDPVARFLYNQ